MSITVKVMTVKGIRPEEAVEEIENTLDAVKERLGGEVALAYAGEDYEVFYNPLLKYPGEVALRDNGRLMQGPIIYAGPQLTDAPPWILYETPEGWPRS